MQFRSFEVPEAQWAVGGYQADWTTGQATAAASTANAIAASSPAADRRSSSATTTSRRSSSTFGDPAKMQEFVKPTNEWNSYRIVARGYHITQKLNGHLMIDLTDQDTAVRRRSGIIALQLHAGQADEGPVPQHPAESG